MTSAPRPPLDAEIARLTADHAVLHERLVRLERVLQAPREVGAPVSSPDNDESARLRRELAASEQRLAAAENAAAARIAELSETLAGMERSIAWRLTAPLRAAGGALPAPVRDALYQTAKGVYWVLTPQRMASRLRYRSYAPLLRNSVKRLESLSTETRARLGEPLRRAYGPSAVPFPSRTSDRSRGLF